MAKECEFNAAWGATYQDTYAGALKDFKAATNKDDIYMWTHLTSLMVFGCGEGRGPEFGVRYVAPRGGYFTGTLAQLRAHTQKYDVIVLNAPGP